MMAVYNKKGTRAWMEEEIQLLRRLADADLTWVQIAEELGRPRQACQHAYAHYSKSGSLGRFTLEEERRLTRLVEAALHAVAKARKRVSRTSDGGAGVGSAEEEEAEIREAAELQRNLPWQAISERFPGRTGNQLRVAWFQRLAPHRLSRAAVGPREDLQLLRSIAASGAEDESEVTWERLHPRLDGRQARQRLSSLSKQLGSSGSAQPLDVRVSLLISLLETHLLEDGQQDVEKAALIAAGHSNLVSANDSGAGSVIGHARRAAGHNPMVHMTVEGAAAQLVNSRIAAAKSESRHVGPLAPTVISDPGATVDGRTEARRSSTSSKKRGAPEGKEHDRKRSRPSGGHDERESASEKEKRKAERKAKRKAKRKAAKEACRTDSNVRVKREIVGVQPIPDPTSLGSFQKKDPEAARILAETMRREAAIEAQGSGRSTNTVQGAARGKKSRHAQ
mmetsp:Transcript_23920/g.73244  ORF Transcript_23920/g.73244 Transcript_23920/m.73244 type:complete len:451 (-) Transcript_23920:507-1859(-)